MKIEPEHRRRLIFAYACFLVAWAVLTVATISAERLNGDKLFYFGNGDSVSISDFVQFYKAGRMAASSDRFAVYDPDVQLEWTNRLVSPHRCGRVFFLQCVPFLFPLMTPFASLSMQASYWALLVPTFLLALFSASVFLKDVAGASTAVTVVVLCGLVASVPAFVTWLLGQLSWLLLALFCLFFWGVERKRDVVSGVMLSLASFKPQYALILLMVPVALRRFKLLAVAALSEVVLMVAAGLSIGWRNVFDYPHILLTTANIQGEAPQAMVNVRGLLSLLLAPELAVRISYLLFAAAMFYAFRVWSKPASSAGARIALTVMLCLVASPHTYLHDCVLLLLPAGLVAAGASGVAGCGAGSALRWQTIIFVLYPIASWILYLVFPASKLGFMLANFALLALAAAARRQQPAGSTV